ncbi:Transcription factor MYB59, partial [Cucurbita argyrosperma subsp. argyrosperma]
MVEGQEIRKGPWTEQEDIQLICFVGLFGDRRWDFIAKVSGLKAQEKRRALSSSSSSSSSYSSNNPAVEFPADTGPVKFFDSGGSEISASSSSTKKKMVENQELGDPNGFSMDDIWKDIDLSDHESLTMNQDVYSEEDCNNFSCPALTSPTPWDYYCGDSLWRMEEEEESKLIFSGYDHNGRPRLAQPNQNFFY